jgi:hypothetical protein
LEQLRLKVPIVFQYVFFKVHLSSKSAVIKIAVNPPTVATAGIRLLELLSVEDAAAITFRYSAPSD